VTAGAPLSQELCGLADHTGLARLSSLAAAWAASGEHGARVATVLDRLAETFDEQDAAIATLSASLAGARVTVALLAGLPAVGVAMGQWLGAHPLRLLLTTQAGWLLLTLAASLEAAGLVWSRSIVRSASR
jgi:tight adherence protein B